MYGQIYLSVLSARDVDDVLQHTGIGPHLKQVYSVAADDIGAHTALMIAVNAARNRASAAVHAGRRPGWPYGNYPEMLEAAELAVRELLGVAAGEEPSEPAISRPVLTINGRPQPVPEGPRTLERRGRLFVECVRRLTGDPLTTQSAYGRMVGYGSGLEGLVKTIAPLFDREQSLVRWVALRGAVAWLYREVLLPAGASRTPQQFAEAMGFAWARGSAGAYELVPQQRSAVLTSEHRELALATANITANYLVYYQRISHMTAPELNADAMCSQLDDDIALECIAWSAVACLRMGIDRQWFAKLPEPDALTETGWYTDPLSAAYQRYWNGCDWTPACRTKNGDKIVQYTIPLR
jgi:hypothetical protein